jgi:hypothetical protein
MSAAPVIDPGGVRLPVRAHVRALSLQFLMRLMYASH